MNNTITAFIDRTHQLSNVGLGSATGISGTNNRQSLMLDLYKASSLLSEAKVENKLDEQIDEVVGVLHVAQAMNVIGYDDLEELMDLLDKIKNEDK